MRERPRHLLDGVLRVTTRQCQKKHPTEKPIALVKSLLPIVPTGARSSTPNTLKSPSDASKMPNPILELLGQKVFFRLVQRYGGQTLRIPTHLNQDLNELLGQENARRLCFYLGGQTLYIPKLTNVLLEQRNQLIRHLRSRGLSVRELALRFDLSERQIWKILQKHHPTPSPSSKNHP